MEATFRLDDCAAILHVGRKRAARSGQHWLDALARYSVLLRVDNPRTRDVRAMPDGDVPGQSARFNEHWQQLRWLVADFDRGVIPDPCPDASDWGSVEDGPRGRMVPAHCSAKMANRFWRIGKARVVSAVLASAVRR